MRSKKITGHYLVKDHFSCMDLCDNFEEKPKCKTGLLNRSIELSDFSQARDLGLCVPFLLTMLHFPGL